MKLFKSIENLLDFFFAWFVVSFPVYIRNVYSTVEFYLLPCQLRAMPSDDDLQVFF